MARTTQTHMGAQLRSSPNGEAVAFFDMAAAKDYKPAKEIKPLMSYRALNWAPWALWGKDNLMPQKMVRDINSTGILSGIIDGKARFALCEGMVPAIVKRDPQSGKRIIDKYIDDPEINMFMDCSDHFGTAFGCMKDQIGLGSAAVRMMLNGTKDKIAAIRRDDFSFVRYEKQDDNGFINSVFLSASWDRVTGVDSQYIKQVPLLDAYNPLADLQKKAAAGIVEHELTFSHPGWGTVYYPAPLWYAAHKWVKIAQGVPEMKAAMFENSMNIKFMVIIYEQYWEDAFPDGAWEDLSEDEKEAKRGELFDDIEQFLLGAKNSSKTLIVDGKRDLVNGHSWQNIEIKAVDTKSLSGDMLPDAATANAEIAFSMLFNPNIVGAAMSSGPYTNSQGGSNVRESVLLQIIIHELERRNIQRIMNVVKWFNGWATRYPGLEFIIPATVLTTLDTGANSKPVTLAAGADATGVNKDEPLDDQTTTKSKLNAA